MAAKASGTAEIWAALPFSAFEGYVGFKAAFQLADGSETTGYIYTVDPESRSVILLESLHSGWSIAVTFGHAIVNYVVYIDSRCPVDLASDDFRPLFVQLGLGGVIETAKSATADPATVARRKEWVLNRLKEVHLPYEEDLAGTLWVMNGVSIAAPYNVDACSSSNETMLRWIWKLLQESGEPPVPTPAPTGGTAEAEGVEFEEIHVEMFEQDGVIYLVDQVHCDVFRMHENAEHDEPEDVGRWDPDAGRVILHE